MNGIRSNGKSHRPSVVISLLLVLLATYCPSTCSQHIAVCVGGQVGRLIPDYFVDGLVLANPSYQFHFFFNLYNSAVIYTTKSIPVDTVYQNMTKNEIVSSLRTMLTSPNSDVEVIALNRLMTKSEWERRLNMDDFGLFQQFRKTGHIMLNMYQHHEDCARQIVQIENSKAMKMSYIISTREDIFFFKPLEISRLVRKYVKGQSCDILTKGCLDFGGLNMRLQFMERKSDNKSLNYMRKIHHFVSLSKERSLKFLNPEAFEYHLAEKINSWKVCKISVEEYPVTAVRLSYVNRSACFVHQELKEFGGTSPPCVPQSHMDFAIMNICPRVPTRYEFIPFQSFAWVPNWVFPKPPPRRHDKHFENNILNK